MDPSSVADFRLGEGVYEFDPDREMYHDPNSLAFFEVSEGTYLVIKLDEGTLEGKCPIYYQYFNCTFIRRIFKKNGRKDRLLLKKFRERSFMTMGKLRERLRKGNIPENFYSLDQKPSKIAGSCMGLTKLREMHEWRSAP